MNSVSLTDLFSGPRKRPILFDGAVGSLLMQLENAESHILWSSSLLFTQPNEVYQLHKDYISAGADVITTNTFRTNPVAVARSGVAHQFSHLVGQAVELAREAVKSNGVLIAGSNPPAEESYQRARTLNFSRLQSNHIAHIDALMDAGVDFVINETISHLDEIRLINSYCSSKNIPYIVSLFFTDEGKILSGETIEDVLAEVADYNPLAVGFNCMKPSIFRKHVEELNLPRNWGFYLNCGLGEYTDPVIRESISPLVYRSFIESFMELNPVFIGGCCGSTPDHIREIRKLFDA
ncbi:MAG: homocysteine S-methyltransferase family protein [Ignavibacteriales bacterium]|nr:homocysteine S-methyltransferase family protein [Ignavibacteriales bacterium]